MSLPIGWICPSGETRLDELHGLRADVLRYFATPHRMLVIRLKETASEEKEPLYVLCTGVERMETPPSWTVDELRCSRIDEDTISLEDGESSVLITCYAVRVFSQAEFKRWMGGDFSEIDPAADDFQPLLKS